MLQRTIRESFRNLWAAKQRSLLALLGIVIGTGSVIAMTNIGAIAEKHAIEQIVTAGVDMVVISIRHEDGKPTANLTEEDVARLVREVPDLRAAIPVITGGSKMVLAGRSFFGSIVASRPEIFEVAKMKPRSGRLLSRFDELESFCVIGEGAIRTEHEATDAKLGDRIQIGAESYTVIGILDRTDPSPMLPFDANASIVVSLPNAWRIMGRSGINTILGRIAGTAGTETAAANIRAYFDRRYPGVPVDVQTATQAIREMSAQLRIYSLLLGAIGGISLIVGGVGVMNVMLMAVAERRTEIGLRMAIGARARDIKTMFLIESLMLSLAGGLIGTILGAGSSAIFGGAVGWTFTLAPYAIPLGAGVSMVVGVFFGIYPAAAAARMNPADALRGV